MAALRTIMRGRVVKIDAAANNLPWVTVPELGVERQIGPCLTIRGDTLAVGDTVLCVATEGTHDDLTVIGKFGPPLEAVATFSELTDVDWSTVPADGQGFVWDDATDKLKPHSSHLVSSSEPSATGRRAGDLWIDPTPAALVTPNGYARSAQRVLMGGGRRFVGSGTLAWGKPFYTTGAGRKSTLAPSGYHEIAMPSVGAVIQKVGVTGTSTVTADAAYANPSARYINLGAGEALWYALPLGSAFNTVGTFYITAGAAATADYEVPENWILIVKRARNYPADDRCAYLWGDGQESSNWIAPTLSGTWVNYGALHTTAAWKKENGWVQWKGLIRSGSGLICSLDPTYNGAIDSVVNDTHIFGCMSDAGIARVDAFGDNIRHLTGGTAWLSLHAIRYWNG